MMTGPSAAASRWPLRCAFTSATGAIFIARSPLRRSASHAAHSSRSPGGSSSDRGGSLVLFRVTRRNSDDNDEILADPHLHARPTVDLVLPLWKPLPFTLDPPLVTPERRIAGADRCAGLVGEMVPAPDADVASRADELLPVCQHAPVPREHGVGRPRLRTRERLSAGRHLGPRQGERGVFEVVGLLPFAVVIPGGERRCPPLLQGLGQCRELARFERGERGCGQLLDARPPVVLV